MSHRIAAVTLLLMLAFAVACGGNPTWQEEPSANRPRANVMIQFTQASIDPETAEITADGNVVWNNNASGMTGTVFFKSSVRDAFPCQMRPLFMEVAGGWQSIPISADSEEVTLPCTPKPGEYGYEIWIYSGVEGTPNRGMDDPQFQIPGKIKVTP